MAWTINVRGRVPLGGTGGLLLTYGDYTTAGGAETTTFAVGTGYPILAQFSDANNNYFTSSPNVPISATVSGGTTTFTFQGNTAVTSGGFVIVSLGG
jgi:hypothetical protein